MSALSLWDDYETPPHRLPGRDPPHVAAFFRDHSTDDPAGAVNLVQLLQQIKGVGPCTAAILATSHAIPPSSETTQAISMLT